MKMGHIKVLFKVFKLMKALLFFLGIFAAAQSGYPWPIPKWDKFYGKSTGSTDNTSTVRNASLSLTLLIEKKNVCSTVSCKSAAQKMLAAINSSVDPCDDFFNYACGNWMASRDIADTETEVSVFQELEEKTKLVLQEMLSDEKESMFMSEVKARNIFKQCQNQEETEQLGAKPLLDLLDDQIGGWPILNPNWNARRFDLFKALAKLKAYGDEPFFSLSVGQDMEKPSDNLIFITEPETFATKDVLLSEAGGLFTESYEKYIFNVTSLLLEEFKDGRDVAKVSSDLMDIMDLGRYISLAGQTAVQKRNLQELKNKTSLGSNQQKTFTRSAIFRRMTNLIRAIFQPTGLSDKINSKTPIVLRYSPFFDRMDEKLLEMEKLKDAGKRRLANYMGWRIITGNVMYMSKEYRDAQEEHSQRIQGQKSKKEKTAAERCAADVGSAFPLAVGAIYVRDYLPVDLKPKASLMVNDIKLGFGELLSDAGWMDNTTYQAAVRKLNAMSNFVAYLDILVENTSAIDNEYNEIGMESTYFLTLLSLKKVKLSKNLKKLKQQNKRDDPIQDAVDVTQVNAYNLVFKNSIVVLAAILQTPFYETRNPEYLNYGGIGFVIGHEITHGFDDQGASFDDEGLMRSWWSNATTTAYDLKKQNFVDQYSAYNLSVGNVNGQLTLGENIADNGGLKASYRAYFNHFQKRLPRSEQLLPGFQKATAERLFFLSAAQVWCGKKRPETERLSLLSDEHSPYMFRVIGPMSNMPEFSRAFKCPSGSKMNPSIKRVVW